MRTRTICLALGTVLAAAGCATQPTQEQTGMVIGGVLGGVLGHQVGRGSGQTAATIIGTIVGAAVGGAVGRSMDETDRMKTAATLETVRTGVPSTWRNPDTGNQYTVVPTRTYDTAQGPCREYTVDAVVAGKKDKVYGTACRQPDGSWRVMD
ncbi:MAG: RT0821/Lpp0805 family surface protein [Pseudomonadota bacterium]